jgi:adenylate cyclase class IV
MARNIEITSRAAQFDMPRERLKLRQFDDATPAELLFYRREDRDDRDGTKASYYTRSPVTNAEALHALLATALTTRGIVTKERHLYTTGRTQIHLDRVDGLGDFVELEVRPAQDDDEEGGHAEVHAMFAKLDSLIELNS